MTIMRYEPFNVMDRLHRQIDQIFGDSFGAPAATGEQSVAWVPSVDVHEEPDRFVVRADLPGVDPNQISVTSENRVLTIRGERKSEKRENQRGFERIERIEGTFLRRFTLPENVRTDDISAKYTHGVLEVTIPKQPAPEPKRVKIDVATGDASTGGQTVTSTAH